MIVKKYLLFLIIIFSVPTLSAQDNWKNVLSRFEGEENPEKAMQILLSFLEETSQVGERYEALCRLAHLNHFMGNFKDAQKYFEKAYSERPLKPDFLMLLYSAALLIEMNHWDEAVNQLDICLIRCKNKDLLSRVHFYYSYLSFLKGDFQSCRLHIQKLLDFYLDDSKSMLTYLPWIDYFSQRAPEEFQPIVEFLKTAGYWDDSIKLDIRLLSPVMMLSEVISLPLEEEETVAEVQKVIVAGSYGKEENADAVLKDLEMQGFSGKIKKIQQKGKTYYRIYVLPIEGNYEHTLNLLKKMEISAFMIQED